MAKRTKQPFTEPVDTRTLMEKAEALRIQRVRMKRDWQNIANRLLVGRTIVAVQYMSDVEQRDNMWSACCPVLELDDGTSVYPCVDDEGNEAGTLHITKAGKQVEVLPHI